MNTQVIPALSFEEKLKIKLKDSIGDLLSDEDLKKLIDKGLQEVFFAPRKNPKRTYHNSYNEPETIPPLLHELVKECLMPSMKKCINEYLENNQEEVMKVVNTVVTNGVGVAMLNAMNMQFQDKLVTFQMSIQNQLQTMKNN